MTPRAVPPLARRAFAEFIGTGLLVTVVIRSGIAAARLSPTEKGLALLENAAATTFAGIAPGSVPGFLTAQLVGAALGVRGRPTALSGRAGRR